MSNLETYREKAVKCVRAAEAHNPGEHVALADYMDGDMSTAQRTAATKV